jgi:DHA1 family tetracycline resistance protein-like MFS transporter
VPKLGQKNSVYIGLMLYVLGLALFSVAPTGWMMFAFLVPYALGGICGPALQGIMSNQVPPTEQGELQGALTSLMSITSVIGPLLMNNIFAYFTSEKAPFYFPGAHFIVGAVLCLSGVLFAIKPLKKYVPTRSAERAAKQAAEVKEQG